MVVEPLAHRLILVGFEFHLDRLQWLHIEDVIGVIERRFLVVERRESHALEVTSIALLSSHHDPHRTIKDKYHPQI